MSYRSALSNPLANSGDVGQVITAGDTNYTVDMVTQTPLAFATITLGSGTWYIQMTELLAFNNATTKSVVLSLLTNASPPIVYFTRGLILEDPAGSPLNNGISYNDSVVVTLTQPTILKAVANAIFTTGVVTVFYPALTGNKFITATKLA